MKWNKKSTLLIIILLSIVTLYQSILESKSEIIIAKNDNKKNKAIVKLIENEETVPVENITVNKTIIDLIRGETEKITVTFQPTNAGNQNLIWQSSNNGIATVDEFGNIKAVGIGTATITVRSAQKQDIKRTIIVRVKAVQVATINTNLTVLEMNVGESSKIIADILPSNADNKELIWASSNPKIATVDNNGQVRALRYGTTTITVTSQENRNITKAVTVKVKDVSATSISTNVNSLELTLGTETKIDATVLPENATNKNIIWTSSNSDIVSVDSQGTITAKKEGKAKITIYAEQKPAIKKIINVTVTKQKITDIRFKTNNIILDTGKTLQLEVETKPTNISNNNIGWQSNNEKIATIDEFGVIHANKIGTTTIIAYLKDNKNIRAATQITVKEPTSPTLTNVNVDKVTITNEKNLSIDNIRLKENEEKQLTISISPNNATNKNIIWESSNTEIVTITKQGIIKGLKEGTATITATSEEDNTKKDTIRVIVGNTTGNIYFLSTQNKSLEVNNIIDYIIKLIMHPKSTSNSSIVLQSEKGELALINTAEKGVCKHIKNELKEISGKKNVDLKYLIITLADEFHTGCYKSIIQDKNITVDTVILKETNKQYNHTNYYDYLEKIAKKNKVNVVNISKYNDGYTLAFDNINIKTYNNKNVFANLRNNCNTKINNLTFDKNINSKKEANIIINDNTTKSKNQLFMIGTSNQDYIQYINTNKIGAMKKTIKMFPGKTQKKGVSACNENTNSLALLIDVTSNEGTTHTFTYLPSSLENNGYPVTGLEERTTSGSRKSNKIIYGNGTTYGINYKKNNKTTYDDIKNPTTKTIFYDAENKVSEQIVKEIGKENLNQLKVYQQSNYGYTFSQNAMQNLGIIDNLSTKSHILYTINEASLKENNSNYIAWSNKKIFGKNYNYEYKTNSSKVICTFISGGEAICNNN